ncbi:MAG TPA: condensation domain-containing protein, partial [Pyrinomonadaceae bacterium]
YVAAFFGCLYAGVVAVPAYPPRLNRTLARLQSVIADASPVAALTTPETLARIEPLVEGNADLLRLRWLALDGRDDDAAADWRTPAGDGDTLAFLQYTSGSTAAPKGVMVSHGNLLHNQRMIQAAFRQTEQSVVVGWLPLYHDMGLIGNMLQPLYLGARGILMSPVAFLQRPFIWLEAVSRFRATTSGGPNFAYELCVRKVTAEQRATLNLSSWDVAFNGAEPVRAETLERFAATFAASGFRREAFQPCYGLAEATLLVTGRRRAEAPTLKRVSRAAVAAGRVVESADESDGQLLVGCGTTAFDEEVVVVEPETRTLCPAGEVGEVWVAGPGVAQGYWRMPEATAQTFRAYLHDGSGPFLRTGDLGALIDGELFVTGRLKDLIIIRGRNHYPQDIELTVERSHGALRPGCGVAFSVEADGAERLVLVQELERRRPAEAAEVCAAVRQAVAEEHELQAHAVVLVRAGSIPKTSSGKLQRRACRELFLRNGLNVVAEWRAGDGQADEEPQVAAPLSPADAAELETWLRAQLGATLGLRAEEIDAERPVTSYGLDSLAATELAHALEKGLGLSVSVTSLLGGQTLAQLAASLSGQARHDAPAGGDATPAEPTTGALSHGQQSLWFLHQLAPTSAAYNLSFAARVRGHFDADGLRRAFQSVVDRHPALRTTFHAVEGRPVQVVHEQQEASCTVVDCADWSEEQLRARLSELAARPFDLERGPVIHLHVFERAADEHVLLLSAHHIAVDFWSLATLMHELGALYTARQEGRPAAEPPPPSRYADYCDWQARMLAGGEGAAHWDYWRLQLAGAPPTLDLPTDHTRPPVQTYRGASQPFALSPALVEQLKTLCRARGVTLYTLLLAALDVLLHRYTGQQDFVVGSVTSGRRSADFRGVVGYFVNPIVLRASFDGDPTFDSFLLRVRDTVLAAFEHQDFPFSLLVERLQPERTADRSPLFQTLFVLQQSHLAGEQGLAAFSLGESGARVRL